MEKIFTDLVEKLSKSKLTLSSAESLTGGLFGTEVTSVPGASKVYLGSVISYDNEVKINTLGVDPKAIEEDGVVSEKVVKQMAEGCNVVIGSDLSISFSGVAGPDEVDGLEVGTVWMALNTPTKTYSKKLKLDGDRDSIRKQSVLEAAQWIIELI